jgi:HSP20 family molecular chaperone IbpA
LFVREHGVISQEQKADVDQEKIESSFKDGVLTVKMVRKQTPDSRVKQIEING